MRSIPFDTLQYSKILRESGIPEKQAEALVNTMNHAFGEFSEVSGYATRADIHDLKTSMHADIKDLKMEMQHTFVKIVTSAVLLMGALQTLFHFMGK